MYLFDSQKNKINGIWILHDSNDVATFWNLVTHS